METKHTPGPWFANDHETMAKRMGVKADDWLGYAWVGFGGNPDGNFQGKLADLDRRGDGHEPFRLRAAADARLIAAAPALLEALIACRDQFDFYAREHRAAEKHDKAATNERFAFLATQAIQLAQAQSERGR